MSDKNILESLTTQINHHEFLTERLGNLEGKLSECLAKKESLVKSVYLDTSAKDVISLLIEKINEENVDVMISLINQALQQIFDDRQFKVFHTIKESRATKHFDLFLREEIDGQEVICDIRSAVGDGVRTTVGLVILIYYLQVSKSARFIVLDEALDSIADCYLDGLFSFLKQIAIDGKFVFLLITHAVGRLAPYADFLYSMNHGSLAPIK